MDFPGEKLVIKLWETLTEKGLGSLLAPWQAGREGKVRNQIRRAEVLMLAQAEVDAADIRAGRKRLEADGSLRSLPAPTSQRDPAIYGDGRVEPHMEIGSLVEMSARVNAAQAARKEINVTKAITHAEEVLANDSQTPPERDVEEDWLLTWREYAGRVSTDDLQQLWGKVLAGEVKSPGSYSLRTLEFLKGLSKDEAQRISKLAQFVIEGCIFRGGMNPVIHEFLERQGISFASLLAMQDLGVVSGVESYRWEGVGTETDWTSVEPERYIKYLRSNGKVLVVEHEHPKRIPKGKVSRLTAVGKELLGLGSFEPNLEYLRLVGKNIVAQRFTVQLADWKQETETTGRYFNPEKIDG